MTPYDGWRARGRGSAVSPVELFVLVVMAAVVVAIAVPSYLAMQDRAQDSDARANVRRAVEAIEAYHADVSTYAGAQSATLRRYDKGLAPSSYRVTAKAESYCIQSSVGGRTWYQTGPVGDLTRGRCPGAAR
jgi:Tfp pilus assembly protein PilE